MAGFLKKIAKWGLIGVGSVLSIINPAIGAPLIVAGTAINVGSSGTSDDVSAAGSNLAVSLNKVGAMQAASQQPGITIGATSVTKFMQDNFILILLLIGGIFILPKLLRRR